MNTPKPTPSIAWAYPCGGGSLAHRRFCDKCGAARPVPKPVKQ